MGLRTQRYTPPTTRCSGAATGAGVPKPSTTKRTNAPTSAITPARSSAPPSTRTGAQYGRGSRTCQPPVNNHGIRPPTTPGANRKNTALPTAAVDLRMAVPHFTIDDGYPSELLPAANFGRVGNVAVCKPYSPECVEGEFSEVQ